MSTVEFLRVRPRCLVWPLKIPAQFTKKITANKKNKKIAENLEMPPKSDK